MENNSGAKRRGERNGAAKLTEAKVRDIRERYVKGVFHKFASEFPGNAGALAREFGVHKRTILAVVYGETWGWVQ